MSDTQTRYLSTFLGAADLPGMRSVQDSRLGENMRDPTEDFARHAGLRSGIRVWIGDGTLIWRLVDIRWLFDGPRAAAAFHREQIRRNSEGLPSVRGAPIVGRASMVFGGTAPIPWTPDTSMTAFAYVFLVGSVLVKLFGAQSLDLPPSTLTPEHLAPLATRSEELIEGAFPSLGQNRGSPR